MHEIYGNARFTLSSAVTSTAVDSMLVDRKAFRDDTHGCRFHGYWLVNIDMPLDDMRTRAPMACRGWIFQEERLSPRVLYWCSQRAYWSCAAERRIECRQYEQPYQATGASLSHAQNFIQVCRGGDPELLAHEWSDIAAAFTRRLLSDHDVVRNRFAAFSGLAVRFLEASTVPASRDEYLAGLWRSSIAQNLAWSVPKAVSWSDSLQPEVPSWSWMSLPLGTETEMARSLEQSRHFQLLSTCRIGEGYTSEEIVRHGARAKLLRVSGRLRRFVAENGSILAPWDFIERPGGFDFGFDPGLAVHSFSGDGRVLVYEPHKKEVIGRLDYLAPEGLTHGQDDVMASFTGEQDLQCLEIGRQALLLLQRTKSQPGAWKRVGVAFGYRKNFFDACEVCELDLV
ncbi:hypothetical protein LTR37_020948 [Vermiconidia calcicola]|uniref:Uncharacterized protein n=1 Tax=Vermiconidia calcicola TaxID=1690605 RepID=A0ACC3MBQ2_9PEZI|nr:hypothetical protein LTR37_020948 [Vermiconidia calcicola]